VMRDPGNVHDANAIRVLIDGVHVGFVPAEETSYWQPILQECERRSLTLVGRASFVGRDGWGIRVDLRDALPAFVGSAREARKARDDAFKAARIAQEAKEAGDGQAIFVTPDRLQALAGTLAVNSVRLRSARSVDPLIRRVEKGLNVVYAHAAAMKIEGLSQEAQQLLDLASDARMTLDDLAEAEDADDRESFAFDLNGVLDEILETIADDLQHRATDPA
jgi:hypothetical protein